MSACNWHYCIIAVTVSFAKSSYVVRKVGIPPSAVLRLSSAMSTDVTIKLRDKQITATSKSTM